MTAYALHLGQDYCHRVPILETAGYKVEECASLDQLQAKLEQLSDIEAIFVTELEDPVPEDAVIVARAYSGAPVILFRSSMRALDESRFDLVIPTLSRPSDWLMDVNAVLAKKRRFRVHSPGSSITLEVSQHAQDQPRGKSSRFPASKQIAPSPKDEQ